MTAPRPRRRISRELTRIANAPVDSVLAEIGDSAPASRPRIGVTGPPGAGKSTLINTLAAHRIGANLCDTMAVLAIDPSSPVSGGSILGDRIRMDRIADLPGLFIRSLSSRGARNGLCDNIVDLLVALERHAFDEIVLETVGTGQSEVEVAELVDTTVLIVPPDAGDSVQTMKSGILEVADIIAVTKADMPGAARMAADIGTILRARGDWMPPVVETRGDGTGVPRLSDEIDRHRAWLAEARPHAVSNARRRRYHLRALIARQAEEALSGDRHLAEGALADAYEKLTRKLGVG
ncbi:ArgK/MeaB family GTPase [Roseovarius salinarum]|uniref:ArgK/MeaB family GTPase n=1 Tax=Roseovarius salinarum TaxID=1981892 RepID=UPI000C32E1F2|nr:GTP-binding protein [Roseovarius salinarum]